MLKKNILTIFILLVVPAFVIAENPVSGIVVDSMTKEPIEGVVVRLDKERAQILTSATGEFSFPA